VDAQTNVYANAGGKVITLSSDGVPLQTNTICPLPGFAKRDGAGNYYFGGSFDGTQNFGGITIVGGWTNNSGHYAAGYPTCFLCKYASNGALQWVTSFGPQAQVNKLTDFVLDPAGGFYVGYSSSFSGSGNFVAHFSNSGNQDWTWNQSGTGLGDSFAVKLGVATPSNCCAMTMRPGSQFLDMFRLNRTGTAVGLGQYPLFMRSYSSTNSTIIGDDQANPLQVGECFTAISGACGTQWLRKCAPGTDLYEVTIDTSAEWILGRDVQTNLVYVGGNNGMLSKYAENGTLIWSNNFGRVCVAMVVDGSGNRFVSFGDGSTGLMQTDGTPQPPGIAADPQGQTVFAGDNVSLSVTANGTPPLFYQWRMNGTDLPGATSTAVQFNPVTASNAGTYTVVVTNAVNSITSAPGLLRVKSVELYVGSQMLTNGSYVFGSPPTLTIRSAFTGGSSYYTLDGSVPTQSSTPYTSPFILPHDATVRAVGYNAGATQSEEADAVNATVYSQHTLTVTISGNGNVTLSPPGGTYWNTNTVTAAAIPGQGSSFLFWLDDASGGNPSVSLSMQEDRSIIAVFATNAPAGTPPGLMWATNLGARLFAVDDQTNVYANNGGAVITLNSSGSALQTNTICPLPGMARRDSAGNYYFAGNFDGTQNFGGITIVGGWTNNNGHYQPGYPTCYLAKYSSNGALQLVTSFGQQANQNNLTDVMLDPAGGFYAAYSPRLGGQGVFSQVVHLSNTGAQDWTWTDPVTTSVGDLYVLKLGGATTSNTCVLTFKTDFAFMMRLDRSGNSVNLGQYPLQWQNSSSFNAVPVIDDLGNAFQAGQCFNPSMNPPCSAQWLRKTSPNTDVWDREITTDAAWTLARDLESTVYVGGTNGMLARYSNTGDLVWSNNFGRLCVAMLTDASDNRFVSFADGTVARLGPDGAPPQSFAIASNDKTQAQFSLTSGAQAWQIQASSNLISWWVLGTITNSSGGLQFSDPSSTKARVRFYRAVPLP
jgi:hypothetical protein